MVKQGLLEVRRLEQRPEGSEGGKAAAGPSMFHAGGTRRAKSLRWEHAQGRGAGLGEGLVWPGWVRRENSRR